MSIHTGSPWNLKTNEVDIYGGQTCSISVNGSPPTPWKAQDWSITSHDGLAKVWSTNSGANITATGPSIRNAQMDSQYGRGKEFGHGKVTFSPATLSAGLPPCPATGKCAIVIYYERNCP